MPIVASDIQFRLSGGAANSDVNAALGGAKSSVQVTSAALHNLFDQVSGAESLSGDTEYRCIYVHNGHATLSLQNAVVWISANTPSGDTSMEVAVGTAAVNGTEQTIANENTAPSGTTFSAPASQGAGLSLGTIPAGQHKTIWLKRIVGASAAAYNTDSATISVAGETAA